MPKRAAAAADFQSMIFVLQQFWSAQGCVILQPLDMEVGAGTFHPATFLRAVGPEPWAAAYIQPSRRPQDGRYGDNPNRLQHYHQFQTVMKPPPPDFQDLFLASLAALGIAREENDIRFVEDNWESPTLGAWGVGWEVWLNGAEIAQFTYFQQVGGMAASPPTGELTYGLERIAMFLQGADTVFKIRWHGDVDYANLWKQNEKEQSAYNFEHADTESLMRAFESNEKQSAALSAALAEVKLPLPAYEAAMKCSHLFNLLDARGVISEKERAGYIARVRKLARACAERYNEIREENRKREKTPMLMTAQDRVRAMKADKRERLRQFFAEHCLLTGEEIKLSAGGKANFYFDCKRATLDGECLITIADWLLDDIAPKLTPPPQVVGGPTLGADSIAAACAMRAAQKNLPLTHACIVRKEPKKHGTQNKIENEPQKGARVLVVEDVITTGGSIARACDELLAHGCIIAGIAALLDRDAGGKQSLQEKYNTPVFALFGKTDFAADIK